MIIKKGRLCGEIGAIPSKSDAHRAIICALLSRSVCKISPIIDSKDIFATIKATQALGAVCTVDGDTLTIDSTNLKTDADNITIDCVESGSTLRFMLAVAAALGANVDFVGQGRLPMRPIDDFYNLFPKHGATLSCNHLPLTLRGKLTAGDYEIGGNISSQYITGLLLSLPILHQSSRITLTTKLESKPYVDMTLGVMKRFFVDVIEDEKGYVIPENQSYSACDYTIDGDWSQAAFFLTAGAVGGNIKMSGLRLDSTQGDREIFEIIKKFGGNIYEENGYIVSKKGELCGTDINAEQIPDLVPIIAVMAAFSKGTTKIYGAGRLRYKESDRIKSVTAALKSFGADVTETDDGMIINGDPEIKTMHSGKVECCNDHRIAMAFSVMAAYIVDSEIIGHECVSKSYPNFFDDFNRLLKGGKVDE